MISRNNFTRAIYPLLRRETPKDALLLAKVRTKHVDVYIYIHIYVYIHIYMYINMCMYICVCICKYIVYKHPHMYACMHVYRHLPPYSTYFITYICRVITHI